MKKILAIAGLVFLFVGCSDNQLEVENGTAFAITMNFRAEKHTLNPGQTKTIKEIPNGTFGYGTVFLVPSNAGYEVTDGGGLDGEVTFERSDTQVLLLYGQTIGDIDSLGTINVELWGNTSTTLPSGALVAP